MSLVGTIMRPSVLCAKIKDTTTILCHQRVECPSVPQWDDGSEWNKLIDAVEKCYPPDSGALMRTTKIQRFNDSTTDDLTGSVMAGKQDRCPLEGSMTEEQV